MAEGMKRTGLCHCAVPWPAFSGLPHSEAVVHEIFMSMGHASIREKQCAKISYDAYARAGEKSWHSTAGKKYAFVQIIFISVSDSFLR